MDPQDIPSEPTIPVLFSTDLLRELAVSEGPIRLMSMRGPDEEGYYEPVFKLVYPA